MNINLTSPANPLGYGVVGTNVLKALVANGHEVSFFPIGHPEVSDEDVSLFQACLNNKDFFCNTAPSIRIWHQNELAQHVGGGMRCGFPIFELDRFTKPEVHHIASQDLVFTCSHWAQSIISSHIDNQNVAVAPLGVDPHIFYPTNPEPWEATRFINIGKWEVRKGHDILVNAFNRAFEPSDNVELWMMNHSPFLSDQEHQEWMRLYKRSKMGDRVFFLDRVKNHSEVADVIRSADCGVFPSRAEGWNLEALEMMACGKEVIITNCSAHTEFCNTKNSKMIQITEYEDAFDGIWFTGQGRWARLGEEQVDQCVEHMRTIHRRKQEGSIFNKHGVRTAKKFSWKNTASKITKAIS